MLFDDFFRGNFLMCCMKKNLFGVEFHILHISADKALHHVVVVRDPSTGGFTFQDEFEDGQQSGAVFTGIVDFLRHQKRFRLSLGADHRSFATVAVADRGNRRVQVLKMFWEKSDWFQPSAHVLFIIGGARPDEADSDGEDSEPEEMDGRTGKGRKGVGKGKKKRGKQWRLVNLLDPVSVAYSASGDLAVCDSGAGKVYLLSKHMEVMRTVSIAFLSDSVIARRRREERQAGRTSSLAAAGSLQEDPFEAIDREFRDSLSKAAPLGKDRADKAKGDESSSPPCSVAFSDRGNLAVGYKNGGGHFHFTFHRTVFNTEN